MKKLFCTLIGLSLLVSLAACGGEKADESSAPAAESSDPVAESSAPGGEESSEPEVSTPWEDIAPAESFTLDRSVYKTGEIKGAPEEVTSYPGIFELRREGLYKYSCETDGGTMEITFAQTAWGTWNLGAWRLVGEEGTTVFVAGSTDLEYVYRAAKKPGDWVWSGGNHGNEKLIDLTFYDGATGKKLDVEAGSVSADSFTVVERTKLHWGDENDSYCNVTRIYTFCGPQVRLNVDYDYTQDCCFYLSYTGMFPVDKRYGLWCDMYDAQGSKLATIETEKVGKADYSGNVHSGNAAVRAVIYGYEQTDYSFDIRVTTFADSVNDLNNDYKTSFWDMNQTQNKLYFSKYFLDKPTNVSAGTQLRTECIWLFCSGK